MASPSTRMPPWTTLARRVELDLETPLLLALSGGADSVFLLRSIADSPARDRLQAAHIDHGLRGAESREDRRFCQELCEQLGVPLHIASVELDGSTSNLEARAREARYRALAKVARAQGAGTLLTAHHRDDALETLMMRWTRGTDLGGLHALAAHSPFPVDCPEGPELCVVRPLLSYGAEELRSTLRRLGQAWREDSSNRSAAFTRNRVRHQLLPWFEANGGPTARRDLQAFLESIGDFEAQLARELPSLSWQGTPFGLQTLEARHLTTLSPALLERCLRRLLIQGSGSSPGRRHMAEIMGALRESRAGRWNLSDHWCLRLRGEQLALFRERSETPLWAERSLRATQLGRVPLGAGQSLELQPIDVDPGSPVPRTSREVHLELPDPDAEIRVGLPRGGERFHPLGAPGSKALRRFLTDRQIPPILRSRVPLVFVGECLAWVVGQRPCHELRVRGESRRRLRLAWREDSRDRSQYKGASPPSQGGDFPHGSGYALPPAGPRNPLVAPFTLVPATLESNLRDTLDSIDAETRRAGRRDGNVRLLAVTKSVGPRTTAELVRLGQKDLGENRLPSLIEKRAELGAQGLTATWHFIGQIQRNKARKVVQNSTVLHSVDSLKLIETLERVAEEEGREVSVYLEVKLSTEPNKHGFDPEDLAQAIRRAGAAPHLELVGLMTMAPLSEGDGQGAAQVFARLADLGRNLESDPELGKLFATDRVQLSMGMSGDYAAAIAEGSHVVRIGSALFRGISTDKPTSGVPS